MREIFEDVSTNVTDDVTLTNHGNYLQDSCETRTQKSNYKCIKIGRSHLPHPASTAFRHTATLTLSCCFKNCIQYSLHTYFTVSHNGIQVQELRTLLPTTVSHKSKQVQELSTLLPTQYHTTAYRCKNSELCCLHSIIQ